MGEEGREMEMGEGRGGGEQGAEGALWRGWGGETEGGIDPGSIGGESSEDTAVIERAAAARAIEREERRKRIQRCVLGRGEGMWK